MTLRCKGLQEWVNKMWDENDRLLHEMSEIDVYSRISCAVYILDEANCHLYSGELVP